ncbi:hypothetical protein NQ314_000199 [Rhamnusium bicolor]|uniref:Uncharacterized protein n=1 Tax=Rhamnusium bicolor TaxID=1586634 RepID=A0AAV8ZXE0_9CUCU|nr:hypothetical protein NQ314_000199 [Rhamnusium bicolor]
MSRNKELISKIGLRLDGRRANELRRIRCKLGVFTQPDGSAYLEQGLTKVLAAVYGPHQVRGGRSKAQHDNAIVNCIYPACVNAATLALIDAGIPIKEYVCACTASLANNDIPMLDISHQEEIIGGPTLTVAALPMSGKIVLMEMSQRFHLDHLQKVLDKALQGCRDIKQILDEAVRLHVRDVGCSTGWASTS